jgi:hypothetical protein
MLLARYLRHFRRIPRLWQPKRFTEHLLVKLLFDRDPKLKLFADKYAVRSYVAQRLGGEQHLTALYAAVDRPEDIATVALPNRFIMKPNHLSGRVKVVKDLLAIDRAELQTLASSWFRQNLGFERGEWGYRDIPRRIMFEELLEDDGRPPTDYRFHCFNGEPRYLSVTVDQIGPDPTSTTYDADFRLLNVRHTRSPNRYVAFQKERPPNYLEMLEIARKLSAGTDFVRVDLYNLGGRIVFGELTNYPGGGLSTYDPPSWDLTLGSYWRRQ